MAGSRGEWAEGRPLTGCCWGRLGQGAGEVEYEPQAAQAAERPEELEEEDQPEAPKFSAGTSEEAYSENRGRPWLCGFATVPQSSPWWVAAYS